MTNISVHRALNSKLDEVRRHCEISTPSELVCYNGCNLINFKTAAMLVTSGGLSQHYKGVLTMADSTTHQKRCSKCGREFPWTAIFFRVEGGKPRQPCRECHNANTRRYVNEHPDWKRDYDRQYRLEHLEERRAYNREYYWRNHDEMLAYWREFYRANPEKVKARVRRHHLLNPHLNRERKRRHYAKNKTTVLIQQHNREAAKRNLPNTLTKDWWSKAIAYWNGNCAVCGRSPDVLRKIVPDHWIPLSSPECPGTIPGNIVPLCHGTDGCNNKKNDHDAFEWLVEQLGTTKAKKKLAEIHAYFEWVKTTLLERNNP